MDGETNHDKQEEAGWLSSRFVRVADNIQGERHRLLTLALLMRLGLLVVGALSCFWIPDFVSGDDSLVVFDLRLLQDKPLFALDNKFCHCFFDCAMNTTPAHSDASIATDNVRDGSEERLIHSHAWNFLLKPLTRWDAARFLRLAHEPLLRHPRRRLELSSFQSQDDTEQSCIESIDEHVAIKEAEQAHAFLPLFPLAIQSVTIVLLSLIPSRFLPPTCEGTITLSAWVLNTVCFVWSTLALYELTLAHLSPIHSESKTWATRTALLFIINPANIFFGTAYSEALGSALVFTACWLFAEYQMKNYNAVKSLVLIVASWCCLWMSCWVRSNGIIYAGLLGLYGIGFLCHEFSKGKRWRGFSSFAMFAFLSAMLGAAGMVCHNYIAVRRICDPMDQIGGLVGGVASARPFQSPHWCSQGNWFNLYAYVQRKHWNVGPFRYYEVKQLPNFLLAGPVLLFSVNAVSHWIQASFGRQLKAPRKLTGVTVVDWALNSLAAFGSSATHCATAEEDLLSGESCLGHYAVLAASVLLVVVLAHIQIGTRLILSTCPAIYWHLVVLVCRRQRKGELVLVWCLLYHLLGAVLHPNWLPWT